MGRLVDGTPIYDDATAALPDPNDREDPLWLRADRNFTASVIEKTFDGNAENGNADGGHLLSSSNVFVIEELVGPDHRGIRICRIKIYDRRKGVWVEKRVPSSMFVKNWSPSRAMFEARPALTNARQIDDSRWEGVSPSGVTIVFHRNADGSLRTFYPLRRGRRG
ncbi:MAG: EndoU domain-containing protein [Flavobacteriaceae bacterium]